MLGESEMQKRNKGCWGKSAAGMQMLVGKGMLGGAGCRRKGALEENGGSGGVGGRGGGQRAAGVTGSGGSRTRHIPRGDSRAPSLRWWLCPGGGAVRSASCRGAGSAGRRRDGGAYGGAARRPAAEREEEIGEGFRGRRAAEPVPDGAELGPGVRAGKARGAGMVSEDREPGLGPVDPVPEPVLLTLSYRLGPDVCTILRLSGPLKEQYAKVPRPRRAVSHPAELCQDTAVLCRPALIPYHTTTYSASPSWAVLGSAMFYHMLCRPTLILYHTKPCHATLSCARACALLFCAFPCSCHTTPCHPVLSCALLCHTALCHVMLCRAVLSCAVLHHTKPCQDMLAKLCHPMIMLYHIVPSCCVLCCTKPSHSTMLC